ncbi:hypothetical protein P7C71_g4975, partial [Lecanoromycetidae sp. Uapishka_2]
MNPPPPPPPPPHGQNPGGRNGLPEGNYDIFIIPPHASGSGFLYLPSLQTQRNSFLAGSACTVFAYAIIKMTVPVLKEWYAVIRAGGEIAIVICMLAVAVGAWAFGKIQAETGRPGAGAGAGAGGAGGTSTAHNFGQHPGHDSGPSGYAPGYNPGGPPPGGPTPQYAPPPEPRPPPKSTWQRSNTGSASGTANTGAAKGGWEKAREETRKKEEERKKAEELRKKREEDEKEKVRQREKDAREREARERREKELRERREKEAREKREKEKPRPASPSKAHHHPTAKTATDDDAYSFRPYDSPKRSANKSATASSLYSESSYAPSQSTSRTTPPPSHRGPYRCKDPDKIVLKAVYSFNNTFTKVPIAQLVSGVGSVTDGLILRITTEGLFIDDDVRGVPQREWDVKAWTLKLVEVWCPHLHTLGASSGSTPASRNGTPGQSSGLFGKKWASKAPTKEETDVFLDATTRACKPYLSSGFGAPPSPLRTRSDLGASQTGEFKGLHVIRASIRDQEGKRYVFVLQEEEGWKVAVGLQRLRRGTQVRALGVSGMAVNETKAILETSGWV